MVLNRCSGAKTLKKKEETYWLDPETKGSLKLTLKKQQLHTTDPLKLTLKKSSASKDFTVVKTCTETDKCDRYAVEVASSKENEQMDDKETDDNSDRQTFENIIVNEGVSDLPKLVSGIVYCTWYMVQAQKVVFPKEHLEACAMQYSRRWMEGITSGCS